MQINKSLAAAAVVVAGVTATPVYADWSANAAMTNNYIWRGLTQTENAAAIQGGLDYAHESGFYAGTWVSNVNYAPADVYSYEHDIYAGFGGEAGAFTWDVGYLYYNYDKEAEFDFGEVYGTLAIGGFSASAWVLANTEAEEALGQDFGFGEAYYVSLNYGFEVGDGVEIGIHGGYHSGDFVEAFNGVDGAYYDMNLSVSKGGFGFMVSDTDAGGPAAEGGLDNDGIKWVVSYSVDIDL